MNPRMPKGAAPKLFLGVHARLVFPKKEDEQAVLDLMRRFSSATRFAYNRLLEGRDRKELKREGLPWPSWALGEESQIGGSSS